MPLILLWPVALLGGCPALSNSDFHHRIDRDQDGANAVAFGGTDCDDDNPAVKPGAPEICDGLDNDCDHLYNAEDPDMPADEVEWYLDADRDGVGRDDSMVRTCANLPGYVHQGGDCDDTDPDQKPGQTWFLDGDGDSWGLETRTRVQCERPSAYSLQPGDCDDANGLIHPGAAEVCNGADDDCNQLTDEADPGLTGVDLWFTDADGDGFGAGDVGTPECSPGSGEVLVGGDCDDAHGNVHPGATDEWYDGIDADCLGDSDYDQDGDGVDAGELETDDCDDLHSWNYPGAPEICDGAPNGCDPGTWLPSDEDGLAAFVPVSGLPPLDEAANLSGGTATIAEDGTLFLCTGSWSGQVIVTGGTVSIVAPAGPGSATLDALGLGAAVDASGAGTVLSIQDLDLTGGTGHPDPFGNDGGCVYAGAIAGAEILGSTITGCQAFSGGGVFLDADSVHIADATISSNNADNSGGGGYLQGQVVIERTTFAGNTAQIGGGAYLSGQQSSRIDASTFDGDIGTSGGGLYLQAPPAAPGLALTGTTFSNCKATSGAGMYLTFGIVEAANTIFSSDQADDQGGGAYVASGTLDLTGGAFTDCTATEGAGAMALGTVTCTAGTAFLRNSDDAVYVDGLFAAFRAQLCDLGAAPDDNTPVDVATQKGGGYNYLGLTTIQCDRDGCM